MATNGIIDGSEDGVACRQAAAANWGARWLKSKEPMMAQMTALRWLLGCIADGT
jgi:hypothetical protein